MPRLRVAATALALIGSAAIGPVAVGAAPAQAAPAIAMHHACTRTSTHHCIRGGEFCPKAKFGKSGWDAKGRRYVCKGSHAHPHWEKP